jgi:uncharacterized protein (DUF433 family)
MFPFKDEIIQGLKDGLAPREIIARYPGASQFQITRMRKKLGLPKFKTSSGPRARYKSRHGPDYEKRIRTMKQAGMSYSEIADNFGVTPQAIQGYLRIKVPVRGNCQKCDRFFEKLHAHHLNYQDNSQYQLLCMSCHIRSHAGGKRRKRNKPCA